MAKQKLKHPRKIPGPARSVAVEPDIADRRDPIKRLAKRKRAERNSPKGVALHLGKSPGKGKAKVGQMLADAGDLAVASPAPTLAGKAVRRLLTKATRRPTRLPPLERLEIAIDEVRHGSRVSPRTRKLQMSGIPKMAQKVIEEAGEAAIEAIQGNRPALVAESVDLLYNLLVMLSASGVSLSTLWAEMDRRELALGMSEKLPKVVDPEG